MVKQWVRVRNSKEGAEIGAAAANWRADGHSDMFVIGMTSRRPIQVEAMPGVKNWFIRKGRVEYNYHRSWLIFPKAKRPLKGKSK